MTQTITPYLLYADLHGALDFLSRAFGFEEQLRYTGAEGYVNHAEMSYEGGTVFLGDPGDAYKNPKELGAEAVVMHVSVDDVDAHCERARAAGAEIVEEPADQEYGDRRYAALAPEGHQWFYAQRVLDVAPEEWGAAVS